MLKFDLKVNWLQKFIDKLDTKPEVARWLNKWIKKSIFFLEWESIAETPVDQGILWNSYKTNFKNLFWELFNVRDYWIFVHEWTKFIRANPFMTRAIDKSNSKVEIIMNNEINKFLSILN